MLSVTKDEDDSFEMEMNDGIYHEHFGDEDEMLLGQEDDPYIYMGAGDEEQIDDMYGQEYQHQFDVDPYSNHPHYAPDENPVFIDAHYINTDQVFMSHQQKAQMAFDLFENPNAVEAIDPQKRLDFCPMARHIPAVRRNWRSGNDIEEGSSDVYIPKCGITLDPEESMTNHMLVRNKIYPKHGEVFVRPESPPLDPRRKTKKQQKLTLPSNIIQFKMSAALRKVSRPKPAFMPEPKITEQMETMTPLPNMYFQRRLTVTAEQIGFNSDNAKCLSCNFIFRQNALLATHNKKHHSSHNDLPLKPTIGMLCPVAECDTRCDTVSSTVKHMKLDHKILDLAFERIVFKDMDQFKKWKSELERLTMSRYSRTSGRNNIYSKSTYYQCQLSGNGHSTRSRPGMSYPRQTDFTRHRNSKRLAKACTAFFHVRENEEDGSVLLRGCTMHSGHGRDVRLLPLTEEMRMEVASLLISGMDENQIIEKMRVESDVSDRRFYLQVYEIRNIYNKIDKFKEDFKRKMENNEPLPDLVNVGNYNRPTTSAYPIMKAQLACSRYPANYDPVVDRVEDPEFDALVDQQEKKFKYERVIQEDGEFNIPEHDFEYMEEGIEYEGPEEVAYEGEVGYPEDEHDMPLAKTEESGEGGANLTEGKIESAEEQEREMPVLRSSTPPPKTGRLEEIRAKKATRSIDKKMQKLLDSPTPSKTKPSGGEQKPSGVESKNKRSATSPVGRNTARKQAAKRRKIDQSPVHNESDSDHEEEDFSAPSTSTAPPTRFSSRLKGKKEARKQQREEEKAAKAMGMLSESSTEQKSQDKLN